MTFMPMFLKITIIRWRIKVTLRPKLGYNLSALRMNNINSYSGKFARGSGDVGRVVSDRDSCCGMFN